MINDTVLISCRKHLLDMNKMVFYYIVREDRLEDKTLHVIMDGEELEVEYTYKQGADIRRKYLEYRMNVSKEIRGEVQLLKPWNEIKELCFISKENGNEERFAVFNKKNLKKIQEESDGNLEVERLEE